MNTLDDCRAQLRAVQMFFEDLGSRHVLLPQAAANGAKAEVAEVAEVAEEALAA
jgi:hypothetical protein